MPIFAASRCQVPILKGMRNTQPIRLNIRKTSATTSHILPVHLNFPSSRIKKMCTFYSVVTVSLVQLFDKPTYAIL